MHPSAIAKLLGGHRFHFSDERKLQDGIEYVLEQHGIAFERESRLVAGSRVDFLVSGSVVIEAKIKRPLADLIRQLHRYAGLPQVTGIVVVTSRMRLSNIPDELRGKPVEVVTLIGAFG